MSDASERFLDLATKPLEGNHELQVHARWELGSKLKPDADDVLEEASQRLEAHDRSKWNPAWLSLGLVLLGLILLGLSAWNWMPQWRIAKYMLGFDRYMMTYEDDVRASIRMASVFPNQDQVMLDLESGSLEKRRSLTPLDLAYCYHFEVFREYGREAKASKVLLEFLSEIDFDNGYWFYRKAEAQVETIIWKTEPTTGRVVAWAPEEQDKVDQVIQLVHLAANAPRYDPYYSAIRSKKFGSLPSRGTFQEGASNLIHTSVTELYFEKESLLPSILALQARKLADQKDADKFRVMLGDCLNLMRAQALNLDQMNRFNRRKGFSELVLPPLLLAARDLQLSKESMALEEAISILDHKSQTFTTNKAHQRAFQLHGSILTSWASATGGDCGLVDDYFHGRYPPITAERLKPNRRSEHAYVAQLLILPLGALLLLVSGILFIFRYRNGRLCRENSGRLADLFDCQDWLHCLGFGVLLPTIYFAVIRYFTPFGGLDWNAGTDSQFLEIVRFVLLFLLMLFCSLQVLRRRLRERMSFFESPDQKGRIGVILTIAGFAALPLLGSCIEIERDQFVVLNKAMIYPAIVAMGALLIWLIALAFRFLFGSPEQALRRQILSRLMVRTMIWAFAIICGTIPLHMAEERFWVKRDTVLRADPEHPARTRYEWEVIQQMKGELLEILAPLEAISP